MDTEFWQKRWEAQEIGFHQKDVHPGLVKHWHALDVPKGSTVFVPLAGKSNDMAWLAGQGYRVLGAELSEIAVDAFFAERGLLPHVTETDGFKIKSVGPYALWCGDYFRLDRAHLASVAASYDRAALVAMPSDMQPRYARKLAELAPGGSEVLLIGLDYDPSEMAGPPFPVSRARVHALFDDAFTVTLVEAREGLTKNDHLAKRGLTHLEEASYRLRRNA